MNCDKVKELLWAYLENKTTAEETAEIETHLEGCAACREELAQQKEIKNALASLPDEELPEDYHTELMQKLQAERKVVPFPAKKKHGWKQMSMIAAAVLVVVVAGGTRGMLEMRQNQNEEIEQILFEDTALMADTGEEAAEQTAADSATENNAAEKSDTKENFSEQETKKAKKPVSQKTAPKEATPKEATPKEATPKETTPKETAKSFWSDRAATMPKAALYASEAENAVDSETLVSDTRAMDSNAADSMTLQVEKKETALQAIRKSIEEAGGYEESSADDVIQAVIPVANYADFLEQVGKLGEIQAFFQGEEDGASRTISISVTEK
ncbi:zf-HC2 domain-containing protein [Anaerotignum faecicola]